MLAWLFAPAASRRAAAGIGRCPRVARWARLAPAGRPLMPRGSACTGRRAVARIGAASLLTLTRSAPAAWPVPRYGMRAFTIVVALVECWPAARAALAGMAFAGRLRKVAAMTPATRPARIAQNLRDISIFLPLSAGNAPDVR